MDFTVIVKRLNKRPFEPFRMQIIDETHYDIRHPEMVIATPSAAYVGIPMANNGGFSDVDIVAMEHVVKLLPLPTSAASLKKTK